MQVLKYAMICLATNGGNLNWFDDRFSRFEFAISNGVSKIVVISLDNIEASHLISKEHF